MSDFAYSTALSSRVFTPTALPGSLTEYIDSGHTNYPRQEAAGKVGKFLGIIAAIAIPFAAPAIFSAIAGSGILTAGLASAAATGTIGTMTSVLGSAVVGGLMNAGVAYASGARGGDVWRAAGIGALGSGMNAGIGALNAPSTATNVVGGTGPANLLPAANTTGVGINTALAGTTGTAATGAAGTVAASGGVSSGIMNGIRNMFGNIGQEQMQRIGAALVNAAVNGQSMGRLDGLVAQQRAELEALRQSDLAAYNQRISAAQSILQAAEAKDPAWHARIAMADVAGMEANQFRQTMRNIATRQGGSLDRGQGKAYERGAALHTARSKALAYNQKYGQAEMEQNQLRAQGAALLGPNTAGFQNWQADTDLAAQQYLAHKQNDQDTWGGLIGAVFEQDHDPATSPDPSAQNQEQRRRSGFSGGLEDPFSGGGF